MSGTNINVRDVRAGDIVEVDKRGTLFHAIATQPADDELNLPDVRRFGDDLWNLRAYHLVSGGRDVGWGQYALMATVSDEAARQNAAPVDQQPMVLPVSTITDADVDVAWAAWVEAWQTTDGRSAMRAALEAFAASRKVSA